MVATCTAASEFDYLQGGVVVVVVVIAVSALA